MIEPRLVVQLTPEQERQCDQLAELDIVADVDRFFFQVCPDRKYCVRPASPVEIEHIAIIAGGPPTSPAPGCCGLLAIVRNVARWGRERAYAFAYSDIDYDTDEIAENLLSHPATPFTIFEIDEGTEGHA